MLEWNEEAGNVTAGDIKLNYYVNQSEIEKPTTW